MYRSFDQPFVESGSERVRREVLNRDYSNQALMEVAERLHRHRIPFRTYNMIGLPTETEEEMWQTVEVNSRMKTDFPRGAIFMPLTGTRILDIAIREGYLDADFSNAALPSNILSEPVLQKQNREWIKNFLCFFQTAVLFPRLRPLIKKLLRTKPNILFRLWFYVLYLHLHRRQENRRMIPYIRYVLGNLAYR